MPAKQNADLCGDAARLPDERPTCPPRIIVCEQSGRWATALRRELLGDGCHGSKDGCHGLLVSPCFPGHSIQHWLTSSQWHPIFLEDQRPPTFLEETRSLAECCESLRRSPAGFVVVELTPANVRRVLQFMCGLEWKYPLARLAVVVNAAESAEQSPRRLEALLLQAGAVFFADTIRGDGPRGVRALAGVALRHIRKSPRPQQSIREEIWARLPWGRH